MSCIWQQCILFVKKLFFKFYTKSFWEWIFAKVFAELLKQYLRWWDEIYSLVSFSLETFWYTSRNLFGKFVSIEVYTQKYIFIIVNWVHMSILHVSRISAHLGVSIQHFFTLHPKMHLKIDGWNSVCVFVSPCRCLMNVRYVADASGQAALKPLYTEVYILQWWMQHVCVEIQPSRFVPVCFALSSLLRV